MTIKLNDLMCSGGSAECDVCIIGAGAAGLYLGNHLAIKGKSVVILEAGGRVCGDSASIGIETDFTSDVYPGATLGRAFGLGGSTSRWGGLLVTHSDHDVRMAGSGEFDPWQTIVLTVKKRSGAVLSSLGLSYESAFGEI